MHKKNGVSALLLVTAASTHAGNAPATAASVPIMDNVALLGLSLVLAGICARFIARRLKDR